MMMVALRGGCGRHRRLRCTVMLACVAVNRAEAAVAAGHRSRFPSRRPKRRPEENCGQEAQGGGKFSAANETSVERMLHTCKR